MPGVLFFLRYGAAFLSSSHVKTPVGRSSGIGNKGDGRGEGEGVDGAIELSRNIFRGFARAVGCDENGRLYPEF